MEAQELQVMQQEAITLVEQARQIAAGIKDSDSSLYAQTFIQKVKAEIKKRVAYFEPMKKAAKAAHTAICDKESEALAPLQKVDKEIVGPVLANYLRQEEEARLQKEREAQALSRKMEEEARLAAAVAAEAAGQKDAAQVILDTPTPVAPVYIPKVEKVQGMSTRKIVKCEIINLRALIEGIIRGEVPITAIEANMTVVGSASRSGVHWPGVRVWQESTIVSRS